VEQHHKIKNMDEGTEIIKKQLQAIPDNLRSYVANPAWSESVGRISKQYNINQDKIGSLENEVLFVLICLEPSKDFVENIKREAGLDDATARKVADSVNGSIFSSVMKDIKSYWDSIPANDAGMPPVQAEEPKVKNYDSFEQTILRQAQAMRPARTAEAIQSGGPAQAPNNLPGATPAKDIPKQYAGSADPYREAPE
jgi:hypothetical protein